MRKILLLICVFGLFACDGKNDSDLIVRRCGDYSVEIDFADNGEKMNAVINGDGLSLARSVSASGAKYDGVLNDTYVTLWGRGEDWLLILDDDMVIECDAVAK